MSVKNYSGIDANGQNVANTVINLQQNSSDLRNFTIYSNENNIGKSCIVQIRDGNRGDNNNNLVQLTTTHTIVSRTVSGIKVFRAAPFTITDDIIREVFEIDASTSINAYIGQDKDISLTVSVEIGNDTFRFNIGATDYVNVYESPEIAYISHQSNDNKMTVNINITDKSTIIGYGDSDGYDPSNNISYIEVKVTDLESNIQKSKDIYTNSAQNSNDNTFTGPTDTLFGSYTAILNNGDDMPLINGNSYIVNVKVFNGFGKLSNPLDEDLVVKPTNVANAPTNIEVSTKYTDNKTGVDGTNVSVTVDWADTDAPSYRSYSKSGNTIIYNEDSENSYVKLRIGTLEAIEENKNIYSGTTGNFIEKVLTNGDIKNMGSGGTITTSISDVPINNWGNTATTTGIVLNAQILHDTHLDGSNEGDVPQGAVSSQFTGYIQIIPTINDILVAVDVGTGDQTFYFNGEVASKDATGATLTVKNGNTTIVSASQIVLVNALMDEQSVEQEYDLLSGNPTITATMTQVDRNGTQDNNSDVYTYTATATFETTRFKTPTNKAVATFTGNNGHDDTKLHTLLTSVNNESGNVFDEDESGTNVVWEIYTTSALENSDKQFNGNYSVSPAPLDAYTFDVTKSYYMKVTKTCTLNFAGTDYNDKKHSSGSSIVTTATVVSDTIGPIYFMQNPTINDILVAVDVGTGDQTFYFNGEVASKDATGATLTVKNGNTTIVSASQIVLVNALMDEQSVEQEYDLLSGNPTITATMTQVDRNGTQDNNSDVYTYTATATFESYSFKTPTAPEGLAIKNVRGNDNKLIARLNKINNMNGYLHAPGTGANDLAYGVNITAYIKSITSIFNNFEEVSPDFDNGYSDSDENKINLEGSYQVDTEYTIVLRKTAYLPYDEFIKYSGNLHVSSSLDRKSEIETELDAVFYMGNPTLDTTTIIDPTTNKITITGNSHGALFTGTPTDLTLIVVANDSLEAYADGTTVAATGSTVYNKAILLSNNNSISGNEEFSVEISVASGISANAPCICIIDPTNSETSITLINFNNVTLPANSNSATD